MESEPIEQAWLEALRENPYLVLKREWNDENGNLTEYIRYYGRGALQTVAIWPDQPTHSLSQGIDSVDRWWHAVENAEIVTLSDVPEWPQSIHASPWDSPPMTRQERYRGVSRYV